MIKNRFEGWICDYHFSTTRRECQRTTARRLGQWHGTIVGRHWAGERRRTHLQNLARTVAQHDLIAFDAIYLSQLLDQSICVFVRIAPGETERVGHRFE